MFEMYAISILVLSRFSKTGFMLGFVYVIATRGTLVVTGKDDNVSGFSECEIRDVCVVGYLRVYRLTKTHSPYSQYSPDSLDTALVR